MSRKITHRPEVVAAIPEIAADLEKFYACLRDPRCSAEYWRGQGSSWFEQAIGTAFDVFAPGLSAVIPVIPRGELLGPASAVLNPLSLPPPEVTARVGLSALGHGLSPDLGLGAVAMPNGFDFFSDIGGLFTGEATFGDVFADVGSFLSPLAQGTLPTLAQYGISQLAARPVPQLPAVRAPAIMPVPFQVPPGMGGMMGRFANRFPNLAGSLAAMRMAGRALSRSKAWSMLRQWGPAALIGIGFTAEAVNELMQAGPGRRRMNPANTKALRRSLRRLQSFERLSCQVSDQLALVSRRRPARRASTRCKVCRKRPCQCP